MEDDGRGAARLAGPYGLPAGMLASFLDSVPASVAILDRGGELVAVNAAWRRFSADNGGAPDCWVGRNYISMAERAADDDATIIAGGLRAVLAGALSSFDHDYPCHGGSQRRWFRCLVTPLTDGRGGMVAGAAVLHLDITAQKLAEQRAIEANHAKTDFLASMSHELRTPLNSVIGFSEMLMMEFWGPLHDKYKAYAGDIHHAGKHLLSLINEVLDLSKVEAGRFELHEETVKLQELARGCMHLVEERAGRLGVELSDKLDGPPIAAFVDARLVRQIVLNLLTNAVKFTPRGGVVTVSAHEEGGWIRLSVADTGIGIAKADIPRVLEPFGQVDSEMARRYQGESTGLGLPLSKRFAELHDGRLRIDSEPGRGTRVTVSFPPARRR
ncbi:MAG: PAS domain-containing sensor histidine kinase [Pseudomonadota bacterium]